MRHDPAGPVLLLPGSRKQAVARIFPALLEGFRAFGGREAVVLYPSEEILTVLRGANPPAKVRLQRISEGEARPLGAPGDSGLSSGPSLPSLGASAVLTSSGTMSMHCALAAIPGAIAYRTNPLTYVLGRMLVKVDYIGIANLLLKEPMYPEFIQGAATSSALAAELRACRDDPARRARTAAQAERLRALLSEPASGTAADWLARQL